MSDTVFSAGGVWVSTYAGPDMGDGSSRKRWQLCVQDPYTGMAEITHFTDEQWRLLTMAFPAGSLAPRELSTPS